MASKRPSPPSTWTARPNRFDPGTWAVFNLRGEVLAHGFATEAEAREWIAGKQEGYA